PRPLVPSDPQPQRHGPSRRHLEIIALKALDVRQIVDARKPLDVALPDVIHGEVRSRDALVLSPIGPQVIDLVGLLRFVADITTPVVSRPRTDVHAAERECRAREVPADRQAARRRRYFGNAIANGEITRVRPAQRAHATVGQAEAAIRAHVAMSKLSLDLGAAVGDLSDVLVLDRAP